MNNKFVFMGVASVLAASIITLSVSADSGIGASDGFAIKSVNDDYGNEAIRGHLLDNDDDGSGGENSGSIDDENTDGEDGSGVIDFCATPSAARDAVYAAYEAEMNAREINGHIFAQGLIENPFTAIEMELTSLDIERASIPSSCGDAESMLRELVFGTSYVGHFEASYTSFPLPTLTAPQRIMASYNGQDSLATYTEYNFGPLGQHVYENVGTTFESENAAYLIWLSSNSHVYDHVFVTDLIMSDFE